MKCCCCIAMELSVKALENGGARGRGKPGANDEMNPFLNVIFIHWVLLWMAVRMRGGKGDAWSCVGAAPGW